MNLDEHGRYLIEQYHERPPFASFLPGIAGPLGVPLWAFYVNRGQGITSFGVESKNASIVEYQPANKAYQSVGRLGFRTFIKLLGDDGSSVYAEPFGGPRPGDRRRTWMGIGRNDLQLRDRDEELGLETEVTYFILPSENVAALVRRVIVRNLSGEARRGELLDGLPAIVPFGVSNGLLKEMSNTVAAWMRADNLGAGIPFYRVEASVEDRPEVEELAEGHFYACFADATDGPRRLEPLVDPEVIFGSDVAFAVPERFLQRSLEELRGTAQIATGKQPCGFFGTSFRLDPGAGLSIYSLVGHAPSVEVVNRQVAVRLGPEYVEAKHAEARTLADELTAAMGTHTAFPRFDSYCRQSFLDNVLRGGFPLVFPTPGGRHVYHVYGRRHGDLERDYNYFSLAPEHYAQGNGAYRDINQNRRCDVLLEPAVEDETVRTFVNLVQLDGYNPLELRPCVFTLDRVGRDAVLSSVGRDDRVGKLLERPFTPGKVLRFIEKHDIPLAEAPEAFVGKLLGHARQHCQAAHHEGYWVDHWSYNLDLIDNYLAIYPERQESLYFDCHDYTYYDSAFVVVPRAEKYVEVNGCARQFGAVREDREKASLIASRPDEPNTVRVRHGTGEVYRTNLMAKLLGLCAVKFATLDPRGMGIEMEAGKPGWCDALNGLPGLFGSSVSETYELQRLVDMLDGALRMCPSKRVTMPQESWVLIQGLTAALRADADQDSEYHYWDLVCGLRESFRAATRLGLGGEEFELSASDCRAVLRAFRAKIDRGLQRAADLNGGLPATYLVHEPTLWSYVTDAAGAVERNAKGQALIHVEAFTTRPLPLYLEGMVKGLKRAETPKAAAELHARVKASALFDSKLGMYKLNASLAGEPMDVGRARAYPPGWLENESIFLHMHYKYLLALLDAGLYAEFWDEARRGLVPFFDPEVYGRSVLENVSFIASSAHPDPRLHGRGYIARLTGATAEFLSMWTRVTAGAAPFRMTERGLVLAFQPALPGWLFDQNGDLSFTFLGKIPVNYHHPRRTDVFPGGDATIERMILRTGSGETVEVAGHRLEEPWASRVRAREVLRIDVVLSQVTSDKLQVTSCNS